VLDFVRPIQGLLGVHSPYGLHTRAVTVYRDTLTEGFSHFVTSMTAPVASGWSGCRVGLTPTGKRRLSTAHTRSSPRAAADCASQHESKCRLVRAASSDILVSTVVTLVERYSNAASFISHDDHDDAHHALLLVVDGVGSYQKEIAKRETAAGYGGIGNHSRVGPGPGRR
jgi:hypothetical protein